MSASWYHFIGPVFAVLAVVFAIAKFDWPTNWKLSHVYAWFAGGGVALLVLMYATGHLVGG